MLVDVVVIVFLRVLTISLSVDDVARPQFFVIDFKYYFKDVKLSRLVVSRLLEIIAVLGMFINN